MATEAGWRALEPPKNPARPPRPPFARMARAHVLAMAGDALVTTALAGTLFFSISPTAARGRVILSLVLTMAPFAIVAPLLGPAIDRAKTGRRLMVVLANVGRAIACVAMVQVVDSLLLFPAAFAVLVLSKTYSVAKSSLVPALVDDDRFLVEANAKLAMVGVLGGFVAAGPGVLLLRFADGRWSLGLAAVMFLLAAVAATRLPPGRRLDTTGGVEVRDSVETPSPFAAAAISVTIAAVATALLRAMVGFLTFLVAFGFRRSDAPAWHFGLVLAASMGASLGGAVLAPRLRTKLPEDVILIGCLGAVGTVAVVTARLDGALWAVVVAAAVGSAASTAKLAFDSIVQRDAHEHEHGRSFARFESGFQLVWVIGALLPVLVTTPMRQGYDVLAVGGLAAAVVYAIGRRHLPPMGPRS